MVHFHSMTLAPRFLVSLWASWRVTRQQRALERDGSGRAAQETTFRLLLTQLAATDFGREHRLEAGMHYKDFKLRVPLREPGAFRPYVDRMVAGDADVLWPGTCRVFVETAGTTTGRPHRLPVTDAQLAHYRQALGTAWLHYATRAGHPGVFFGRHLHVGESTALRTEGNAYVGGFDAMIPLALSSWVEANLYAPPAAIADQPAGPAKSEAIARSLRTQDVTLLAGAPNGIRLLADKVRAHCSQGKVRLTHLQALWPNLECYVHTGAPLGLLGDELHALLGPGVAFHEVFAGAEGWYAAQDGEAADGLRLLAEAGLFYEFLPMRDYSEDLIPHLGVRCVPLAEVEPGADYALVVTTPAGLCRCLTGDIVHFHSVAPPRLHVAGRTRGLLSLFGERVTERELVQTLLEVCARSDWSPVNFHVAPFIVRAGPRPKGGHEWWIELRPGTLKTPTGPGLAEELDLALAQRNRDYATRRHAHGMEPPVVRLVMPGLFEQWGTAYHPEAGASRLPACRSDRLVADQLMALARFHAAPDATTAESAEVKPRSKAPFKSQNPFASRSPFGLKPDTPEAGPWGGER